MSDQKTLVGKSVSWVRFESYGAIRCVRCTTKLTMDFPWNVRRVVRLALFFEREHSHCAKQPVLVPQTSKS